MASVYDPSKKDVYLQRCTDVHLIPDCSGLHTQNTVVSQENIKRETMEMKKRKAQASSDPWKEDWNLPLQSDTILAVLEAQCLKDNGLMEWSQMGGRTAEHDTYRMKACRNREKYCGRCGAVRRGKNLKGQQGTKEFAALCIKHKEPIV